MTTPRFGIGVPTATEGMMYPVPFASAQQAVELAVVAEELGYDSVWGNDHLSTQAYVREEFDQPPSFFDPLGYLAYVAARTERIRLATCVLVLPFRHPVVAAKQLATLDQLSGGRVVTGVGIGAYREELEALHPGIKLHRGNYAEEAIRSLRLLFTERRAGFDGELIRFSDVESYPKPLQPNLPILSGGNSAGSKDRAGRLADGWLPACLTPEEVVAGRKQIDDAAQSIGRELTGTFEVALQVGVSVAPTREEAEERFRASQVYAHLKSLSGSTLKDQHDGDLIGRNLVGTPDDVADQIRAYVDAGVSTFAGLLFACSTVEEKIRAMELFSAEVMPRFG
ncbi:LLM class flavin-dependent oxidoreductase [Phytoactinopolyspora alkaliphila]|uniref:LLM class flavin-dependent oxidoreductase n=1 Tax=Phytoactinopolyspora alkaliphila TaxID=1783498 RepID=A0A6N9YIL9_9ACTN|nr:LLM class flavin-dependent oxidoreductase [Phytoactinopolyspora alkaliphila]